MTYPKLAGTNVFRDFVEFRSQVNEMWMLWSEVLANYAMHFERGDPLPAAVIPPRYSSPYFAHIFAGDYSAGYYSYVWSAVREADTVDWFKENGGLEEAPTSHGGDPRVVDRQPGGHDPAHGVSESRGPVNPDRASPWRRG